MREEQPPNYRSYTWEDEATGAQCLAFYPDADEADDDRKAQLRAMARRAFPDLDPSPDPPTKPTRPALRLIHGGGS
ncbi:hypothetical protein [Kitasatospora putterlickiae]|uniref:hypothetical protein n=1 Tax=Kitasatospora putterlickiae TaxID=221725 RepID=UPI0031E2F63F